MGHDHYFYHQLVPLLEHKYKIILLDYPSLEVDRDDALEYLVRFFASEIHQKTEGQIILGGLSLGATLSFRLKDILGEKIKFIFAMATGGMQVARARKEMILYAIDNLEPEDLIQKSLSFNNFTDHFSQNQETARDYLKHLKEHMNKREQSNFITLIKAALEVNYEDQMKRYQGQTAIIWAEKDKVFSMRHLKKLKKIMPQASTYLLADLGHYLPLESPEQVAKIVLEHEIPNI